MIPKCLATRLLWTLLLSLVIVNACGFNEETTAEIATEYERTYLTESVPPCVATDTAPDPCPSPDFLPLQRQESSVGHFGMMPWYEVPSFTERLLWDPDYDGFTIAQIVVRGTVKTGTTRCKTYKARIPDYIVQHLRSVQVQDQYIVDYYHYSCFADVEVKEYIVGKGPSVLTVLLDRLALDGDYFAPDYKPRAVSLDYHGDPEETAKDYEGREMIFFLGAAPSIAVEAWAGLGGGNMWFLTTTETGIRAVAEYYELAILEKHRSKLNLPLDEMIADIKQAAINREALTGGRIGMDPDLPMFITDAHNLRDYYTSVGAVYGTTENATVLPPPVPGEDDPTAPTLPVNDGTTVTTVPVPGEETTAPPATDDAGLSVEQTTTTTTEPTTTSSTTTTLVASTTTEVAPADTGTATTEAETTTTTSTIPETVTGTTTTTTEAPNEEDITPPVDDTVGEEEQTPTTTSALRSDDDNTTTTTVSHTEEQTTTTYGAPPLIDGEDPDDETIVPPPADGDIASPADDGEPEADPAPGGLPTDETTS